MTTTTKQRKSSKPRSVRVITPVAAGQVGILRLTEGKVTDDYAVWTHGNTDTGRGFRMLKCGKPDAESYDVELGSDGTYRCECRGFLRWDHCKHGACLSKLAELGKL